MERGRGWPWRGALHPRVSTGGGYVSPVGDEKAATGPSAGGLGGEGAAGRGVPAWGPSPLPRGGTSPPAPLYLHTPPLRHRPPGAPSAHWLAAPGLCKSPAAGRGWQGEGVRRGGGGSSCSGRPVPRPQLPAIGSSQRSAPRRGRAELRARPRVPFPRRAAMLRWPVPA